MMKRFWMRMKSLSRMAALLMKGKNRQRAEAVTQTAEAAALTEAVIRAAAAAPAEAVTQATAAAPEAEAAQAEVVIRAAEAAAPEALTMGLAIRLERIMEA